MMSKPLSLTDNKELLDAMGGAFVPKQPIADADFDIASASRRVRAQIQAAFVERGFTVRRLAKKLDVTPAAVSRHLRSEGDIRISTAVLFARALDMHWEIKLVPNAPTITVIESASLPRTSAPSLPHAQVVAPTWPEPNTKAAGTEISGGALNKKMVFG